MKNLKQDYLHKLRLALHNHPEIEDILNEISTHMEDGIKDKMLVGKSEKAATEEVLFELGNPLVLGKNFMQPARSRTMIYLILLNWAFFVCGICLTLSHQLSDWAIVKDTWNYLSHKSNFILLLYSMYWVYLF